MGEGGAWRGGLLLAAFVVIGIALFATGDSHSGTSAAGTRPRPPAGDEPCGGAAVRPRPKSSSVGGLSGAANLYDVTVRIAASDLTRAGSPSLRGRESNFQTGYGVVQCTLLGWSVNAYGSSQVGCSGTGAPPAQVRTDLELACPS
jgi:hypothetical protein